MFFGLFGGKKKTPQTPKITEKPSSVKNKTSSSTLNNSANNVSNKAATTKKPVMAEGKTTEKTAAVTQTPVKSAPTQNNVPKVAGAASQKSSAQEKDLHTKEELNSCADFCTREED